MTNENEANRMDETTIYGGEHEIVQQRAGAQHISYQDFIANTNVRVALQQFCDALPWQGTRLARIKKYVRLHNKINAALNLNVGLAINVVISQKGRTRASSSRSSYNASNNRITLNGKLSAITFFHEWMHAIGYGQSDAVLHSNELFAQFFPEQASRLITIGDMRVTPGDAARNEARRISAIPLIDLPQSELRSDAKR